MKFERKYEDEYTIEIWSFDSEIFDKGPISVDIEYKKGAEKSMKQHVKETKQQKKIARQMKKINSK